jgi:phosphatidylinositol alpha-1,6-mannosyltransferase
VRLLLITNDFPPKPGGIQQYLRNFVEAYDDPLLVLAPFDSAASPEPNVARSERSFMWPTSETLRWIVEQGASFLPDVVLFGAPHPLPLLGARLREALGVPVGVLCHGAEVTLPAAFPGSRQVLGWNLRSADVRFAVSRYTRGKVERLTGREVVWVGAGVDVATFRPADPPPDNDPQIVGCVSRFVPRKGQHRLLEAAARLGRPVEVLFVGKGRKEDHLRTLASRLGVRARFEVDVPWSELAGLYQQMDVFAMPCKSRWGGLEVEGLGLVFLEAAATGLPVLAGDSGGSPETVVAGDTGFVVHDVDDIVEGLGLLFDDPKRARRMGAAGRAMVERDFTWPRVVERVQAGFGDLH